MLTLISATPSPYARKNRIALLEKGIPFQLQTEIPWESATETPKYNPLEKLPILIFDDGRPPIYESWYIQEYIVQKYKGKGPSLMPEDLDDVLYARQIQIVADAACDAMVLDIPPLGNADVISDLFGLWASGSRILRNFSWAFQERGMVFAPVAESVRRLESAR